MVFGISHRVGTARALMTVESQTKMNRQEAQRRFEKALVMKGYHMQAAWTEPKAGISHLFLRDWPQVRAMLWPYRSWWEAQISLIVGEQGEFPLTGGRITRTRRGWMPKPYKWMEPHLIKVWKTVNERWNYDILSSKDPLIRWSLEEIRREETKKAKGILWALLRGEFDNLTISASLSLAQSKWAPTRESKLRMSQIWWETLEEGKR